MTDLVYLLKSFRKIKRKILSTKKRIIYGVLFLANENFRHSSILQKK